MKHYNERCEHCHSGQQAVACTSCGRWCCEGFLKAYVRCGEFVCSW